MELIRYEAFHEKHVPGLTALWNRELGGVFPLSERLFRQNAAEDRNVLPEGSWVAIDGMSGRLAGYIIAKCWRERIQDLELGAGCGWIHSLLVDSGCRRQGIGSELLGRAEKALQRQRVRMIRVGNDFHWRLFPGVPEPNPELRSFLSAKDYEVKHTVYDMHRCYDSDEAIGEAPPFPEVNDGQFRVLEPKDREAIIEFMQLNFPGNWDYQTRQYWERGGTGKEFVVLERAGDIVGFCRINDPSSPILAQNIYWSSRFDGPLGGIGPLGLQEAARGAGYGLAIVQAGIRQLLRRGVRHIVIDTTPYVDFYAKLGYSVWQTYTRMEKSFL